MTGADFYSDVRDLLADQPERSSTGQTDYDDTEIRNTAVAARSQLVKLLFGQRRSNTQPFQLTLSRMVKTISASAGSAVPTDFWKLISGYSSDGLYVPAEVDPLAQGFLDSGDEIVTVQSGKFQGTATQVNYVAMPTQDILNTSDAFTEFSDAVYECLELITVYELLMEQDRGVLDMIQYLGQQIGLAMATLT